MNAMQALERDQFAIEAEAYCRQYRLSPDGVPALAASLRQRAFTEEIQPILRIKADVYSRTMPSITFYEDDPTRIETEWKFCEADQKILDDCDKLITAAAERYRPALRTTSPQEPT